MHEWKRVRLGEVADEVTVGHVGPMVDEYRLSGVPFLRSQNVLPHRIDLSDIKFIDGDFHSKLKKSALRPGDVVTVRTGKPGTTSVVPDSLVEANCSDLVITRPGPALDAQWLSYYVNAAASDYVSAHLVGAVQQHFNVGAAKNMVLHLPPLKEQQAIAEVLAALDDKIAANTRLIDLLVQHQFAEFEIALRRGRESRRLDEVADFHNRKRVPLSARERHERPGSIPYYGATGIFGSVDRPLFNDNLVLVGEDGSVITPRGLPVVQYIWGPSWVNNHAHVLAGSLISTELFRFAVGRTNVAALVTGAVQPKISMGKLKALPLELPTLAERSRLERLVASEMAIVRAKAEESRTLVAMRDLLLPQLMSGKIRVKDAEQMAGMWSE